MQGGFSLYVHLPYCLHKCPYCDFNTYAVSRVPERRYLAALERELAGAAEQQCWRGRTVRTVFFGGGTPSLFSPQALAAVLERTDAVFGLETGAEISMEVNPGSLEGAARERLQAFRAAGINRISIGGQSFHDRHLHTLGRIHGAADTLECLRAARWAGFRNLSCDLIFAIPDQSLEEWRQDLERLLDLQPDHVSAYGLTYETGTPLTGLRDAGRIEPASEELELAMLETAVELLEGAGLERYEISNYARTGHACRHNLAYWRWEDYLGLGAGAHGFCRLGPGPVARRYRNHRLPESYMTAAGAGRVAEQEDIDLEQAVAEFLLLRLRLIEGFTREEFRRTFGVELEHEVPAVHAMQEAGMLEGDGERVRLSGRGLPLADAVIARLAAR